MDKWFLLFKAAVDQDRQAALDLSLALGYLVGGENPVSILRIDHTSSSLT